MTERQLVAKMSKWLNEQPECKAWKIHGGPHQPRGIPDLLFCWRGRFVAIEVKLPGKERNISPYQAKSLSDVVAAGGFGFLITSVEQLKQACKKVDKKIDKGKTMAEWVQL